MNNIIEPEYKEFNYEQQYTMATGDGVMKWNVYKESEKPLQLNRWNVLKNFLSVVQFLTEELKDNSRNPILLYIGVTTPRSIILLSQKFPTIRIHVYAKKDLNIDKTRIVHDDEYLNDNQINEKINITIYERNIDDKDIEIWQNFNSLNNTDIFLVSKFLDEIMSFEGKYIPFYDPKVSNKNNELLINNMKIQENYVLKINPYRSLLKFQLPKVTNISQNDTFTYFRGEIRTLAYSDRYSMETSLKVTNNSSSYEWSINRYEDMIFYRNKYTRFQKFENQFNKSDTPINLELGLTNNFDSNLFVSIIRNYLIKHNKQDTINSTLNLIAYIVNYLSKKDSNYLNFISSNEYIFSKDFKLDI